MKIKLDENLPAGLAAVLAQLGHDTDTVRDEACGAGTTAPSGARHRRPAGSSSLRTWTSQTYASSGQVLTIGLVLVRLKKPGRRALAERVAAAFRTEDVSTWERAFVVLTDSRTRVHRPE
jgi:hypothetical protein